MLSLILPENPRDGELLIMTTIWGALRVGYDQATSSSKHQIRDFVCLFSIELWILAGSMPQRSLETVMVLSITQLLAAFKVHLLQEIWYSLYPKLYYYTIIKETNAQNPSQNNSAINGKLYYLFNNLLLVRWVLAEHDAWIGWKIVPLDCPLVLGFGGITNG